MTALWITLCVVGYVVVMALITSLFGINGDDE